MKVSKIILIIVVILIISIFLVVFGVKTYWERESLSRMTPEQIREFKKWRSEKLPLKNADLEVQPLQESTLQILKTFGEKWEEHQSKAGELSERYRDYRRREPKERNPETLDILVNEMEPIKDLLDSFTDVVNQPDYEIDVMVFYKDIPTTGGFPAPDFHIFQTMFNLLSMQSDYFSSQGNFSEAFRSAETVIRASKSHRYGTIISRLVSCYGLSIGSKSWYRAVNQCGEISLLRETYERMKVLSPPLLFDKDKNLIVTDTLGMIRIAMSGGVEGNIENMTGQEIFGENQRIQADFLEKIVLPNILDNAEKLAIEKTINSYREMHEIFSGKEWKKNIFSRWTSEQIMAILYTVTAPNFQEAIIRETVSRARYDLLLLNTARKLYTLEKGKESESLNDLVPDYLSVLPKDPFTPEGKDYGIKYYIHSIGPDQLDQNCTILYDPTNGTVSEGDLLLIGE